MRNIPIDISRLSFVCGSNPEPSVDRDSGQQKTDPNGRPLWQVRVMVMGGGGRDADVELIKVPGEPPVGPGQPFRPEGLYGIPWIGSDGKSGGVSLRAETLTPIGPAATSSDQPKAPARG